MSRSATAERADTPSPLTAATIAEALAQLRTRLAELYAERARRRAAYEAIGLGSLDPAFGRATYAYAVADMWCAQLEDRLREIERRAPRAAA